MPYFLLRLDPPRPTFPSDATEAEKALFSEHAAYWIARAGEGSAIAVGPVFEPGGGSEPGRAWGLALVEAADQAEATALGAADPVITAQAGFAYRAAPVPSLILRQP
ncbi:YciI family protein [Methylobacterium sp. Leaf118]|uniref:YciI family protein n=1 Tax=Methylobacterium sp. Leaf118 TaxID=2876562 RepID=UPI001E2DC267|nr:YciI family protein [Methylobacterium sp. Leaf118]